MVWFTSLMQFINLQYMNQSVQEITTYECTLTVNFITLSAKFPCRMHLRSQNQKLTEEVACSQLTQFVFNQELSLRDATGKGAFELTVNLTTEKGSNIVAGLLRMEVADLLNSQGQAVNFGLYNCVDPYAKCQVRVGRVRKGKLRRDKSSRIRTISGATSIRMDSKEKETAGNVSNILGRQNWKESQRIIDEIPRESTYRPSYLSPAERDLSQRRKSHYSREKYKVQFDAIENNLRLDIIKYKAKIEELERANEERERQIKNLNKELNSIKLNEYNQIYYNEEIMNKNKLLETYENYLKEVRKENEQLRNKRFQMEKNLISFEESKKFEIQKLQSDFDRSKFSLVKEIDVKKEDIKYLQFEIDNKNTKIEAMKRMIEQYQRKVEEVENQYNLLMRGQREESKRNIEIISNQLKCTESVLKIEEMTRKQLQKENQSLRSKLKDKDAEILLIIQEANITKPEYKNYLITNSLEKNNRNTIGYTQLYHESAVNKNIDWNVSKYNMQRYPYIKRQGDGGDGLQKTERKQKQKQIMIEYQEKRIRQHERELQVLKNRLRDRESETALFGSQEGKGSFRDSKIQRENQLFKEGKSSNLQYDNDFKRQNQQLKLLIEKREAQIIEVADLLVEVPIKKSQHKSIIEKINKTVKDIKDAREKQPYQRKTKYDNQGKQSLQRQIQDLKKKLIDKQSQIVLLIEETNALKPQIKGSKVSEIEKSKKNVKDKQEIQNKKAKLQAIKKRVEEYTKKVQEFETNDDRKIIQILENKIKFMESVAQKDQIAKRQYERELQVLKNRLRDRESQLVLMTQLLHQVNSKPTERKIASENSTYRNIRNFSPKSSNLIFSLNNISNQLFNAFTQQQCKLSSKQNYQNNNNISFNQKKQNLQSHLLSISYFFSDLQKQLSNYDQAFQLKFIQLQKLFSILRKSFAEFIAIIPHFIKNQDKQIDEIVLKYASPNFSGELQSRQNIQDFRQLLQAYPELNNLFIKDLLNQDNQAPIEEIFISSKTLTLKNIFEKINEYIGNCKQNCFKKSLQKMQQQPIISKKLQQQPLLSEKSKIVNQQSLKNRQQQRTNDLQRLIHRQLQQKQQLQAYLQALQSFLTNLQNNSQQLDQKSKIKLLQLQPIIAKLSESLAEYIIILPHLVQNHRKHIDEIVLKSSNPHLSSVSPPPKPKLNDLRQLILAYPDLNSLFLADVQKRADEPPLEETLICSKTIALDKILRKINDYIRKCKDKSSELHRNCERLKAILQDQFQVKNDLKDRNLLLINQKAEIGLSDVQKTREIMTLEAENAGLRMQIQEIMEDYHRRMEVISTLKENLAELNQSIQNSHNHQQEFQSRTDRYEAKIKRKEVQLRTKDKEIMHLQAKYKEIIEAYIKQISEHSAICEAERGQLVEERSNAKQEAHQLKLQVNQLRLDNAKLIKSLNFLKENAQIDQLAARQSIRKKVEITAKEEEILKLIQQERAGTDPQ